MTQAHLFRMVRLNDRFGSQVFTFLIPASIAQDSTMECHSKDFMYGNQKWAIMLAHEEKHLSAYLTLKNVSEGMVCVVDFGFTMLNQEHFTKNESFLERNIEFTRDRPTNGRRIFVPISDILGRRFENEDNYILLECEIRGIKTNFEQIIQLPREGKETSTYRYPKFETNYFTFGNFDWNLSVYPFGDSPESEGHSLIYLTRQTSFGHLCRVRYRLILGYADRILESDILEQVLDTSGSGNAYDVGQSLYPLAVQRVRLPLRVELLSVTAISEVQLDPCRRGKNKSHLYDRDKQAWMLETEIAREVLKMKLYYADVHNVPRGFSRLMCWGISVIPLRGQGQIRRALRSPFVKYYTQDETDEGYEMFTDISNSELITPGNPYRDIENQKMTIHIEWIESHLLLMGKYHRLDETTARHKMHMAREIQALQAENLALEKQLYSYQQSIAKNNARGMDPGTPLSTSKQPLTTSPPDQGIPGGPVPQVLPGQFPPGLPGSIPQGPLQGPPGRGPPGQQYNINSPSSGRRREQRSVSATERPVPGDRNYDRVAQFQRSNSSQSLTSDRGTQAYNGRAPVHMRSASAERRAHLEKDGYPGDRDAYSDIASPYRGREYRRQTSLTDTPSAQGPAVQPQVVKPGAAQPAVLPEQRPKDITDRLSSKGNDTNAPIKIEPLGDNTQKVHPKQKPQAKVEEALQTVSKSFVIPPDDPYLSKAKEMLRKKSKEAASGMMDPYNHNEEDDLYPPNGQDYSRESYRDTYSRERDQYARDGKKEYNSKDAYADAYTRDSYSSRRNGHHSSRTKEPYGKEKENPSSQSRSSSASREGYSGRDRDIYAEDPYYSKSRDYRSHDVYSERTHDGYSDKDSGYKSSSQQREAAYRNSHKNSYRDSYSSSNMSKKEHRNSYSKDQTQSKSSREAVRDNLFDVHYNDAYQDPYEGNNDPYLERDLKETYNDKRTYARDYHSNKQVSSSTKDPYNERYPGY